MDETVEQMKKQFNIKLTTLLSEKASNSVFLTRLKYIELIAEITQLKQKTKGKTPVDYHKLKRFDVLKVRDGEKLIYPVTGNSPVKYYVCTDELFDVIHDIHVSIGHGGRGKMSKEINKTYKNVTTETILIYLHLCEVCKERFTEKRMIHDNSITPTEDDDSDIQLEQTQPNYSDNELNARQLERRRTFIPTKKKIIPPTKRRVFVKNNKAYTITTISENNEKDEYRLFGEQVALKIRKLSTPRVKALVQYAINTVLFEAEMGKYDDMTTIPQAFAPTFNTINTQMYNAQSFSTDSSSSAVHCSFEEHLPSEDTKTDIIDNLL